MTSEEQRQLLALAEQSIRHGLETGRPLTVDPGDYPPTLQQPGACFVTLRRDGELRGCIGSLNARQPLVQDLAHNAWAAAFQDPRFMPLQADELAGLELHVSVLGPAEALEVADEAALLAALRPDIDGLILEEGPYRATFLPSVWKQLPEPEQFVQHLKHKAGLPGDYWSAALHFSRYQCEGFGMVLPTDRPG